MGKPLTTVLNEVLFIVNLYSFPCPSFHRQSLPSLRLVICPLPRWNNFQNSPLFQQNGKQYWLQPLSFKISLKDTSFHISLNSLVLYLCPQCSLSFLSNVCIPPCVAKCFKVMEFTFLENALVLGVFTPNQNSPPTSCHHALDRRKLLIPSGCII